MQVAGLKSITAKHLALSCQCLGFFIALQPSVLHVFSVELESHRKALLAPEMGRLLQDLAVHRDEIYAKLVTIMRERLLAGARQLHQSAEKWGEGKAKPNPTAFAEATAKQLRVLRGVLLPLMNKDDLAVVFGRISGLFGTTLAESYGRLQPPDEDAGAWEAQRRADTILLLQVSASLLQLSPHPSLIPRPLPTRYCRNSPCSGRSFKRICGLSPLSARDTAASLNPQILPRGAGLPASPRTARRRHKRTLSRVSKRPRGWTLQRQSPRLARGRLWSCPPRPLPLDLKGTRRRLRRCTWRSMGPAPGGHLRLITPAPFLSRLL